MLYRGPLITPIDSLILHDHTAAAADLAIHLLLELLGVAEDLAD
jgi:hypothetical protein